MKTGILLFVVTITLAANAQVEPPKHDWKATLDVIDESGKPVPSANVRVWYGLTNKFSGLTDSNGLFIASHHDATEDLVFEAEKEGYYPFRLSYHLGRNPKAGKWNPEIAAPLRKIGNPIAMYDKRLRTKLETEDNPIGFDLKVGDWVAPNGKGEKADLFFAVHRKIINERDYDCTLIVSFPNKGDGIVAAPSQSYPGSAFKTSRTALETGYRPELHLHYTRTEQPESVFGYFIRVRTVSDEIGQVKSALYGKIPGNLQFYAGTKAPQAGMGFTYYLNPTPNDRNVEFDPSKNLITNLKPLEAVKEP